ncbi:STAS domain-containing protein [Streptomyces sp. NPDC048275]|uniref:STAS domain-containing protein n=1 Tax=Streptomyces sp. NPDC048275 TaxID=3155629 RepID=UPI0033ECB497
MTARRRTLLAAGAWLLTTAVLVWTGTRVEPSWAQLLCLIAAAAALRTALHTARPLARTAVSSKAQERRRAVVHLHGEINATTAGRARRQVADALAGGPAALEVDLTKVSVLTRDGTRVFFDAVSAARSADVPVVITGANTQVRSTLHTIGLDRLLHYTNEA